MFTQPTLTSAADRPMAAPAAAARIAGLGAFSKECHGSQGTAIPAFEHTDDGAASCWLSALSPQAFLAGRWKLLGTGLPSSIESMVRAASGWLCARPSNDFQNKRQDDGFGTARGQVASPGARAAAGWLSARRPDTFMAGRLKFLGTELQSSFAPMVRAASGWLIARPSGLFQIKRQDEAIGTSLESADQTDAHAAAGWLSAERPDILMAGRVRSRFFGLGSARFKNCLGRVSSVLTPSETRPSSDTHDDELGTARRRVEITGSRAAPGWLSARESATFPEGGDYHRSVFPRECVEWMEAGPGKFIVDGTLGGGGHSELFLKAGARVMGVDRDPEALAHARRRLAAYGDRFITWEGNFACLPEAPEIQQGGKADGLLLDLGVSSRQLDAAERGFSFMREGPLDMRMGPSSPRSAADVVNTWDEAELVRIMFEYGEEKRSRRIARAIVERRATKPFETTTELAGCIEKAIGRRGRIHPATRAFQAIRMAVNEELDSLATALANAPAVLKPGGLLLVITFHSLEDRMVKRFLKHRSSPFIDEPGWPEPRPNPDYQFQRLARKAIAPSTEEINSNPRARSAKLRVARLLDNQS
ncbi:MAG: 16S rRNA (cytosine(1402)-N(4))-methyltransferase RsmH [Verrucomicrobiales bacterium]